MTVRPTFFVDRCTGKGVARALREAGANVEHHDDHFAVDAADVDWIPVVTSRGWLILTKDKNIRRRASERHAVVTASARIITLSSGSMTGAEMASLVVTNLQDIEALAATEPAPFVAVLDREGLRVVLSGTPTSPPPSPDT